MGLVGNERGGGCDALAMLLGFGCTMDPILNDFSVEIGKMPVMSIKTAWVTMPISN